MTEKETCQKHRLRGSGFYPAFLRGRVIANRMIMLVAIATLAFALKAGAQSEQMLTAIRQGDTALLEALIKADPRAVNTGNRDGETPLHWAALSGHANIVDILVKNGANVNAQTRDKWTPLHWAALKGHIRIAEILLDNGADINAKTDGGWTPLHVAAYQDEKNIIPRLIERGADVNARDSKGKTPIETIAEKSRATILQLVEHGADLEPVTATAWSPFRWASKEQANRDERAELLKKTRELETKIAQTDQLRDQLRKELEQTRAERSDFDKQANEKIERMRSAKDAEIEGLLKQITNLKTDLAESEEKIKDAEQALKTKEKDEKLMARLNARLQEESEQRLKLEQTMAAERRSFQNTIDQLHSRIKIAEQNVQDATLLQEQFKEELAEQTEKNEELMFSLKATAEANAKLKDQEIAELKNKWIDDQAGITGLQERIKHLETERVELLNKLEAEQSAKLAAERAVADTAAQARDQAAELENKLKTAEQHNLALSKEIEEIKARHDEAIRAITQKADTDLKLKDSEALSLRERWAKDQETITSLETRLKAAEALRVKLAEQIQNESEKRLVAERNAAKKDMEFQQASAAIEDLRAKLTEAREKQAQLESIAEKNKNAVIEKDNKIASLTRSHEDLVNQTRQLRNTLENQESQHTEIQRELREALDKTSQAQREAEAKLKDAETAEIRLRKQLEQQEGELNALVTNLKAKQVQDQIAIAALEEKLKNALAEKNKAETELKKETAAKLDMESELAAASASFREKESSLNNTISDLRETIASLESEKQKLLVQNKKTTSENSELTEQLADVTADLDNKTAYAKQLEDALNTAHLQTMDMKESLASTLKSKQETEALNQSLSARIEKLTAQIETHKNNETEMNKLLAKARDTEKELSTALLTEANSTRDAEEHAAQLQEQVIKLETVLKTGAEENKTLSEALAKITNEKTELEQKLQKALQAAGDKDEALAKLTNERDTLAKENKILAEQAEDEAEKHAAAQKIIEELQNTEKKLSEKILITEEELDKKRAELKPLQTIVAELKEKLKAAEVETTKQSSQIFDLIAENNALVRQIEKSKIAEVEFLKQLEAQDSEEQKEIARIRDMETAFVQEPQAPDEILQETTRKLEEQKTLNESLNKQIAELTKLNKELTGRVAADTKAIAESDTLKEAINRHTSKLNDKIKALEQTLKDTAKARIDTESRLENSLSELEKRDNYVAELEKRLTAMEALKSELEETRNLNQELTRQAVAEAASKTASQEEAEQRIQKMLADIEALQQQLNQARLAEITLQEQIRDWKNRFEEQERKLDSAVLEMEKNKNEIIAALQNDMEKQQSVISDLQKQLTNMDALKAELTRARDNNKQLSTDILKEATARLEAQEEAEERTAELTSRISGLEQNLKEAETERLNLLKSLQEKDDETAAVRLALQERLDTMDKAAKDEISSLKSALSKSMATTASLQAELKEADVVRQELSDEKAANTKLASEISELARAKLQMQRQLEIAQKETETATAELRKNIAGLEQKINEIDFSRMQALHELKAQQEENAALKARIVRLLADPGSVQSNSIQPDENASNHSVPELTRVRVTRNGASLRARPETDAQVVCQVNSDTVLAAVNVGKTWVEVIPPAQAELWIHSDLISGNTVNAEQVHVRSGPGINHEIVGQLIKDDEIRILAKSGVWIKFGLPRMRSLWIQRDMITPAP